MQILTTNILKSMSNGQKILFSFLAGAAAGVVAGLLLAPESGKETRKKLAKKATDLKNTLEGKLKSFKTEETTSN
jgi:gas vesicle protein